MKARLLYCQKVRFQERYLMELTIHDVGKSVRYPDGVKFGLLLFDLETGHRVLMDNHYPKGPHIHLDNRELPYEDQNDDRLIEDFKQLVREHLGVTI